jgi:hypothetical protein
MLFVSVGAEAESVMALADAATEVNPLSTMCTDWAFPERLITLV